MALADRGVVETERVALALLRISAAEPKLVKPRSRPDPDAEAAGRDLEPKVALVVKRHVVKSLAAVDDKASENIEPSGRALRIRCARQVRPQLQPLHQPRDIDDALLQHRPLAGQRHGLGVEAFQPIAYRRAASRQEACAHTIGFPADPQVEARGLELRGVDLTLRPDQFPADHGADLLPTEQAERSGEQGVPTPGS